MSDGYRTVDNFDLPYYRDAMHHWQRMFAQARECLLEARARGAMADDAEMLARWDATQRKELHCERSTIGTSRTSRSTHTRV